MLKFKGDCTRELWAQIAYGAILGRDSAEEAIQLADKVTEAMDARIDWEGGSVQRGTRGRGHFAGVSDEVLEFFF